MKRIRLAFYHGNFFIRWQTRSDYSHVATVFEDGLVVEALFWDGVIQRQWTEEDAIISDVYYVEVTVEQYIRFRTWVTQQIGSPYDRLGVLRFLSRRKHWATDSWFCSELPFYAFAKLLDIWLQRNIEPWAVSPALLSISPLLRAEENRLWRTTSHSAR